MQLNLVEIKKETEEAGTFIVSSSEPVSYKSGVHMSMMLPIEHPDERGKVRTLTLSSSPTEDYLSFTTKRGPSSFKQSLFGLRLGASFQVRGPSGGMVLDEIDLPAGRQVPRVMIAGGIGITPFRSMIKYAFDKNLTIPITLLYSNKTQEDIVFRKELDDIARQNHSIRVIYTITQPEESREQWSGRVGRIDEALIRESVADIYGSIFYIAGPDSMVTAVLELLHIIGVPKENILFEKFAGYE